MNRTSYNEELESVVNAVASSELSTQRAGGNFVVTRSITFKPSEKNVTKTSEKSITKKINLTKEEESLLLDTIKIWSQYGNAITKLKIIDAAKQILKSRRDLPVKSITFSRGWVRSFICRHIGIFKHPKQALKTGLHESLSVEYTSAPREEINDELAGSGEKAGCDSTKNNQYVYIEMVGDSDSDER